MSVGAAVLPASLRQALAATVKEPPGGSLRDVEHIVILMQENRSFDHYFGTMPGVRGFSDPAAIRLPDGSPVFRQPHLGHAQGYLTPFRLDTSTTSAQATPGTDHSWATRHEAWNNGKMDQWGGHHPGRRRGRAAHRPARGVRQPGPAGPGDQRAGPAPVTIFEDRTRVVRAPVTPQRGFIGTPAEARPETLPFTSRRWRRAAGNRYNPSV